MIKQSLNELVQIFECLIYLFLFTLRSIPGPVEAHLETNLQSGRDPWKILVEPPNLEFDYWITYLTI